jgi:prephenate dehydratase
VKVAIQGELGSNSHMAAREMLGDVEIVPCSVSADVLAKVVAGEVDGAVLPIENSLHGSVAEHYDLLLEQPVRIVRESLLRIRHNLIAMPGVKLEDVRASGVGGGVFLRYGRECEAFNVGRLARCCGSCA